MRVASIRARPIAAPLARAKGIASRHWVPGAAGLAARLKVVNDPASYDRCDSGVLYLRRADWTAARAVVSAVLAEVGPALRGRTPALTKPLAPGLAVAEDPGGGESYGLTRCTQIAEGIARAHEHGVESHDERVALVVEALTEAGVDVDAPYLAGSTEDAYEAL